jgi:hypothetical protein
MIKPINAVVDAFLLLQLFRVILSCTHYYGKSSKISKNKSPTPAITKRILRLMKLNLLKRGI